MAALCKCLPGMGGGAGASKGTPQFLFLGLSGAGKTTMLYRLKLGKEYDAHLTKDPGGKKLQEDMANVQNICYHYEEFSRPWEFGAWDIPGTKAMRPVWASIYRMIKIHCIVFVVNAEDVGALDVVALDILEEDTKTQKAEKQDAYDAKMKSKREQMKKLMKARTQLHLIINEDELRHAAVAVIINDRFTKDPNDKDAKGQRKTIYNHLEHPLMYMFNLDEEELHKSTASRVRTFIINCADLTGETDQRWLEVMDFQKSVKASA